MSHPLNESSLSSTVAHSKHLLLMHEAKTAHTRDEITENLQSNKEEVELSPQMKMMQDIVNSLPEGLLDTKIPVVIASKKKEQKGDWQPTVGPLNSPDFEPTQIAIVDNTGKPLKIERGTTYLAFIVDGKYTELKEIEIPTINSPHTFVPTDSMYERNFSSDVELQEAIDKYQLYKLAA